MYGGGKIVSALTATFAAIATVCALAATFTVSDYYIFNRFLEFGVVFPLCQWLKKAGLILIILAAFFKSRRCADSAKYFLPVFVIVSCFTFGKFFDIAPSAQNTNEEIFNSVNSIIPKWLNIALFIAENVSLIACCALFFVRDGFAIDKKSLKALPAAILGAIPLNIFENFFDIEKIAKDSPLRFYNFTVWHFIAICALATFTLCLYYYLKNFTREEQDKCLAAIAVSLLLQYHSKDSMVMGDGYNVYRTVWACLPLFICNIGVYMSSASVIFKKRWLYSIAFFVHAVGALTVFVYFGKDEMSNYGIFCSYSILYFCYTHCFLFALCVLPSALGHYRFRIKDCIIPLAYYFGVIIVASLSSGGVSALSTTWTAANGEGLTYDGVYVTGGEIIGGAGFMRPNYAFTQVNPLPFEVPNLIKLGGIFKYINIFYVLLVYAAYVGLFFAFYGLYGAYLAVLYRVVNRNKNGAKNLKNSEDLDNVENASGAKNVSGAAQSEAAPANGE